MRRGRKSSSLIVGSLLLVATRFAACGSSSINIPDGPGTGGDAGGVGGVGGGCGGGQVRSDAAGYAVCNPCPSPEVRCFDPYVPVDAGQFICVEPDDAGRCPVYGI
jgi:hypothetical protein